MEEGGPSLAAIAAQFRAQLAAVSALQAGSVPSEATVLAACGGRVPQAAVAELAAAAASQKRRRPSVAAAPSVAGGTPSPPKGLVSRASPSGSADGSGSAPERAGGAPNLGSGASRAAAAAAADDTDATDAERLRAAIRGKLRRLAPQQRKVQQEVLLEHSMEQQCSPYQLMDWRRMRRPAPGANPRAFESPLQPTALLLHQQALRAQKAAAAAKAERQQLQRQHLALQEQQQEGGGTHGGGGSAEGDADADAAPAAAVATAAAAADRQSGGDAAAGGPAGQQAAGRGSRPASADDGGDEQATTAPALGTGASVPDGGLPLSASHEEMLGELADQHAQQAQRAQQGAARKAALARQSGSLEPSPPPPQLSSQGQLAGVGPGERGLDAATAAAVASRHVSPQLGGPAAAAAVRHGSPAATALAAAAGSGGGAAAAAAAGPSRRELTPGSATHLRQSPALAVRGSSVDGSGGRQAAGRAEAGGFSGGSGQQPSPSPQPV